jgi:hypothetical protein
MLSDGEATLHCFRPDSSRHEKNQSNAEEDYDDD